MIISGCFDLDKKDYGFYHSSSVPKELKNTAELSEKEHMELFDGQSSGKIITWDEKGIPYLADPPPPQPLTNEETESLRENYYTSQLDALTSRRSRRLANNSWSEADEVEYLKKDTEVAEYLKTNYPYT